MSFIETEKRDHVLIITLNRPEARNAFNEAMASEMEAIIDDYETDKSLRVAIITANGPTFSAGQDLKAALKGDRGSTEKRGGFGVMRVPPNKPLIAAVDGQALAGGMELCLTCDMVVATERSVFGLAETKRGLIALGGGCFRLMRRIPYNVAMEMILSAEARSARQMYELGFVNRLVANDEDVLSAAMALATVIARNGPLAVKLSKAIATESSRSMWSDSECWQQQSRIAEPIWTSKDKDEGLRAFAEKRTPVWVGE